MRAPELEDLARAFLATCAAEDEVERLVQEIFPVGTYVEIPRGNGFVRGHVVRHASGMDVVVELPSTGADFRISVWSLVSPFVEWPGRGS